MSDENGAPRPPEVDEDRRALATWLWRLPVVAAAGGAAFGLVQAYRIHFSKPAATPHPRFADRPVVDVGSLAAFAAPWDAVPFTLAGLPCVAIRLREPVPGGVSEGEVHLAGFSRICTHLSCIVDMTYDPETIAFAFNHRTDRPQLTCACHYSVFDPASAGRAVSGPAVRPLPRVRLRVAREAEDQRLLADGLEVEA